MSCTTAYLRLLSRPPRHGLVVIGALGLDNLVHPPAGTRTVTSYLNQQRGTHPTRRLSGPRWPTE